MEKWGDVQVSKKSDKNLIGEMFAEYRQMMLKIALGILHNKTEAEDAVQDAFLRIMNNLVTIYQIPRDQRTFYFVSAIENVSYNILKKTTATQRRILINIVKFPIYKYIDRTKKRFSKILNERGVNYDF